MMPQLGSAWIELVRSLGQALLDVFRAESEVLGKELGETGKQAGIGTALVAGAAMVLFWFLGVATLCLIAVAAIWMPTWAAAGTVGLLLLAVAAILAGLGMKRLKSLESPVETVGRRWSDHQSWWNKRLLTSAEPEEGEPRADRKEVSEHSEGEPKELE